MSVTRRREKIHVAFISPIGRDICVTENQRYLFADHVGLGLSFLSLGHYPNTCDYVDFDRQDYLVLFRLVVTALSRILALKTTRSPQRLLR